MSCQPEQRLDECNDDDMASAVRPSNVDFNSLHVQHMLAKRNFSLAEPANSFECKLPDMVRVA